VTRPDPLGVEPETAVRCPLCWALEGVRCYEAESYRSRKPHAARIKAAEQARREKEENRG